MPRNIAPKDPFNLEPDPETFYLSATPRVRRLNHLLTKEAPGDHPGSRTPSRISDGLHLIGHVARGSSPQRTAVRPELPFGRSFQNPEGFDFGGSNTEASPYPSNRPLSRFGTVSDQTDWLALTGFLVELFAVGHFWTHAEKSHPLGSVSRENRSSPCQLG